MTRIAALLPARHRGVLRRRRERPPAVRRRGAATRRVEPAAPEPGSGPGPRAILGPRWAPSRRSGSRTRTGFCYGVREAIDKAKEATAAGKTTHTLGQVVHNEGVDRATSRRSGSETVETLDDVDHGAAVVIRAHGVRPEVMERANERGLEVIDGTCTWVIQEQRELVEARRGGLHDRPARDAAPPGGRRPARLRAGRDRRRRGGRLGPKIPRRKKMALISQSTQPPWKFEKLAAFMVGRSHELKIVNTVCPVTIRRQEDTLEAARERRPDGRRRRPLAARTRRS